MAERRRIPEVERLEGRDMPAVLGVPVVAPPLHLGAVHADVLPQVAILAPTPSAVDGASAVTRDVIAPIAGAENSPAVAAVWQQSAAAFFSVVSECSDPVTTVWTQPPSPRADAATDGTAAPEPVAPSPQQQTPTIAGVLRYAWKSINRHRVDDREDAVQQVCLEWLLLAATVATTYDDVRRIVSRVLNRAYRRMKKQELALELLDVPVNADPVQDALRDMQLDRDMGMNDLTDREWQAVRLRAQGYSFTEIGRQMGMRRQRAYELFAAALSSLRKRYRLGV